MTTQRELETNKMIYRNFIQSLFNEGRLDKLSDFVAPNYTLHHAPPGTATGPEAIRQVVSLFRTAFPDLKIVVEGLIAEGDTVAARSYLTGTHGGPFLGIAPTGNSVRMPSLTQVRISEGRLCESWVRNDMVGLFQQLEVRPKKDS